MTKQSWKGRKIVHTKVTSIILCYDWIDFVPSKRKSPWDKKILYILKKIKLEILIRIKNAQNN